MQHKDTIVKSACLDYVVKHLKLELAKYDRLCKIDYSNNSYSNNHPCERAQWRLVTHLIATLKTLTSLDTELRDEYKRLFETVDKFEKEK